MKTLEADVIVVAAGLSGLAASIAAAENGAQVLTFEKAPTTGGAANMGMGPFAVGSFVQQQHLINLTPGAAFRRHMYYTHYQVDARMVRDFYFKSGDTIRWLSDMGVRFAGAMKMFSAPEATRAYSDGEATWHVVMPADGSRPGPRCASAMTKAMTDRAEELGVEILYETPVHELIKDGDEVVGVRARDKNGEEVEAWAGAVIICTGGFGANPEMIKELTGFTFGKDIHNFAIPGMVGDGIKMAWKAGVGKTKPIMEIMYQLPDNMNHFYMDGGFRQPCLWVNRLGDRFMPEDYIENTTFTGNALAQQPDKYGYAIFDQGHLDYWKKNGGDIISMVHPPDLYERFEEEWARDIAAGYEPICEGLTIEEIAQKAGIDAAGLKKTFDEYNASCAKGWDELFEKEHKYLRPFTGGKLYCCRQTVGAYGSIGGIKINYRTECVTDDWVTVPGLYAAGTDACNIFGDSYPFILPGNTMGYCLNSGRIAGENAAKYAAEH